MTAHATRRETDIQKLRVLGSESSGKVKVVRVNGNPPSSVELELLYPTAGSKRYPHEVQQVTRVLIEIGARYPFAAPQVTIKSPIIHPNVYASGQVCLGAKWLPTQGLDLLVKKLISIITFDASILNESSPANREALNWYVATQRQNPSAFPTVSVSEGKLKNVSSISWNNTK